MTPSEWAAKAWTLFQEHYYGESGATEEQGFKAVVAKAIEAALNEERAAKMDGAKPPAVPS